MLIRAISSKGKLLITCTECLHKVHHLSNSNHGTNREISDALGLSGLNPLTSPKARVERVRPYCCLF